MIPDFQTIMLPLLEMINDTQEHSIREIINKLAIQFNLSETERKELLSSGKQTIFDNRVGWARTYLKKAGLLTIPKRGFTQISTRGSEVLQQNPSRINVAFLNQYPEFVEFHKSTNSDTNLNTCNETEEIQSPQDLLETSYKQIKNTLAEELLDKVLSQSPVFFERLVIKLLVGMGYGGSIKDAGEAIGRTGDEGIDGTIKEDKLGLDVIYIQAKRWNREATVGRPEIHKFIGALAGQGAKKGIFITTSKFTKEAKEYTPKNETKIILIDGEQLTQLMIDYNIGVSISQVYEIKEIDSDFFEE